MRPIVWTTKAVCPDLPPIDALEPRLSPESLINGFVTSRLVFHRELTPRLVPWSAMGGFQTCKAVFGKDHGFSELLLYCFDFGNDRGRRQIIRQWVVIAQTDGIERVPEVQVFELGSLHRGIRQRAIVGSPDVSDNSAPLLVMSRELR